MTIRHFKAGETKSLFDELIDRHAEAYMLAYPEIKEFSGFERSGTFNYYIGMIWTNDCEKPEEGRLRIRGSHSIAKNKLVELDVSAIDTQQSFFPGQIIAFKADPFQNRSLTVRKVIDPIKIAPPLKNIDSTEKISVMIAAGPLMQPDTDDWTLLDRIIDAVPSHGATHLILIGPLVDSENRFIRSQYDTAWKTIIEKLYEGLHSHKCHIYLVPSNRDILPSSLSPNHFYPCSKFELPVVNLKKDAKLDCLVETIGDPSQIDLGGVYLDVTSAEILFHMNKCLLFKNKAPGSPFNSVFKHIITQGIYPLYPSPADLAVDYVQLGRHLKLDRLAPHIIVLPTRFGASVSNIENRLVVTVQKCSVKKQAILVEIPKIEGGEHKFDSVLLGGSKDKIIDLVQ